MSIIPTVRVMREDGKGYHLVNAPDVPAAPESPPPASAEKPVPKPRAKSSRRRKGAK